MDIKTFNSVAKIIALKVMEKQKNDNDTVIVNGIEYPRHVFLILALHRFGSYIPNETISNLITEAMAEAKKN